MNTDFLKKHSLKLIPIAGWIFILIGIIWPFENRIIYICWLIDIFLSCIVHPLQYIIAIPLGKKMNIPISKVIIMFV